jgi:hypothetical protein
MRGPAAWLRLLKAWQRREKSKGQISVFLEEAFPAAKSSMKTLLYLSVVAFRAFLPVLRVVSFLAKAKEVKLPAAAGCIALALILPPSALQGSAAHICRHPAPLCHRIQQPKSQAAQQPYTPRSAHTAKKRNSKAAAQDTNTPHKHTTATTTPTADLQLQPATITPQVGALGIQTAQTKQRNSPAARGLYAGDRQLS